ncbi:MAG TPA: tetratricopeptide repeat protein [Candidatus Acidoferrales bacterium]|nr:tetratricopeptide repeat protein [Candidatus Acidoferrales bacterium]
MPEKKKEFLSYFENLSLLLVGILFVLFPIFFLSSTTDAFVMPKQLLLIILSTLALLIFAVKTLFDGKLRLRVSPFDIPVTLLIIITLVSAAFATNRYDGLIAAAPMLFLGFLYFVIINTVKTQKQLLFLLGALTLGGVLAALLTTLSFFKIYPLPFSYTHATYFTTFGSLLDQALYYALILPIAGYFGYGYINTMNKAKQPASSPFTAPAATAGAHHKKSPNVMMGFGIAFIIIAIGLGLTVFMLFTSQKPLILPFGTGLQTAFAAISQNNVFKSLLLGSGYGTYLNDFTKFKPATYNVDQTLWAFTFFRSSSFALELMATAGLLGIGVYAFLIYRIFKEKNYFLPLMLAVLASLVLPFSFTMVALLFILLALFAIVCIHNNPQRFGEAEFSLLAFRKGFLIQNHERGQQSTAERRFSKVLPSIFLLIVAIIVALPLYFITRFTLSDLTFQQSLVAESQNNGLATYQLQTAAITIFPYRDIYYRAFAQTNLALANALATHQPKNSSPSAQTQKDILTLIQQSINAGRAAVTVAPETSFNWNNLSSVYRSLIGFGQNADQFTVLTLNQAIALDPNNPQQYIDLGGVYYQLGQYDNAIREFQIAINLKQDYANAYYNLGHAYEQKGDYTNAMTAFTTVKQLVADNAANTKIISDDIDTLNKIVAAKSNGQAAQQQQTQASPSAQVSPVPQQTQPITVNEPSTPPLPTRNPREKIPGPSVAAASPTPGK